jgi:hypothetical protein
MPTLPAAAGAPPTEQTPRFVLLLVCLGAFLGLQPLLSQIREEGGLQAGLVGLLLPLFGIWIARGSSRHLWPAVTLSTLSVLGNLRHLGLPKIGSEEVGTGTALIFTGYMTYLTLSCVLRSRQVTFNVIAGAVAGYLMLGVTWAMMHLLIDQLAPGAYSSTLLDTGGFPDFPKAVYFSFITLLTIGYGDLVPVSAWARSMTLLEGITGFIFGTIVVAWLVANHIEQAAREKRPLG